MQTANVLVYVPTEQITEAFPANSNKIMYPKGIFNPDRCVKALTKKLKLQSEIPMLHFEDAISLYKNGVGYNYIYLRSDSKIVMTYDAMSILSYISQYNFRPLQLAKDSSIKENLTMIDWVKNAEYVQQIQEKKEHSKLSKSNVSTLSIQQEPQQADTTQQVDTPQQEESQRKTTSNKAVSKTKTTSKSDTKTKTEPKTKKSNPKSKPKTDSTVVGIQNDLQIACSQNKSQVSQKNSKQNSKQVSQQNDDQPNADDGINEEQLDELTQLLQNEPKVLNMDESFEAF